MGTRDPRVDAYIKQSQPFAQEILSFLRELVHDTVPDVEETMKWRMPHFDYQGILCSMAAFKAHCAFGFWLEEEILGGPLGEGMGSFGKITGLKDLPSKTRLRAYLRKAKALNEQGVTRSLSPTRSASAVLVPPELAQALAKRPKARRHFEAMSASHRREYCEWIAGAKKADTRERRVAKAIELLAEGKSQNWKYESRSS